MKKVDEKGSPAHWMFTPALNTILIIYFRRHIRERQVLGEIGKSDMVC